MSWSVVYTRQAAKDAAKAAKAGLRPKIEGLLAVLAQNPFRNPPPYKSLGAEQGVRPLHVIG